jgi:hypothetical protein
VVRSGPLTDMKARAAAHKAVEVLMVYSFVQFQRERELIEISIYRKEGSVERRTVRDLY